MMGMNMMINSDEDDDDFCFTALQHIFSHFGCGQLP